MRSNTHSPTHNTTHTARHILTLPTTRFRYKALERGKWVKVGEWKGTDEYNDFAGADAPERTKRLE